MLIQDVATLERVRARLRTAVLAGTPIGYDTEWDAPTIEHRGKGRPDILRATLTGYSLSFGRAGVYIPVNHAGLALPEGFTALALRMLRFVTVPTARVVTHNAKGELHLLHNLGIQSRCHWLDTELAAWLCGERLVGDGGLKLKALCRALLGYEGPDFDAVAKGRKSSEIPADAMAPYAAKDAELHLALWNHLVPKLEELNLGDQYALDRRLLPVTAEMERTGISLNSPQLTLDATRCEAELAQLEASFLELTTTGVMLPFKGREPVPCPLCATSPAPACATPGCLGGVIHFKNGRPKMHTVTQHRLTQQGAEIGNDRQVGRWLFDELRWWPTAGHPRTTLGWSVAEEDIRPYTALPGRAGQAAVLRLRYQALRKYASTYTRTLVDLARQSCDGRLHAGFKQDGTATQRFSSSGPNLQNLPKSERLPLPWLNDLPDIRASMSARTGHVLVVRDLSQIELRLTAHYSRDPLLLQAYRDGLDLHAITQERFGGIQRTNAKIANFSCIYRISAPALARKIALATNVWPADPRAAQRFIDQFYATYPGVAEMHERFIELAERHRYAETITGFKRPLTDWGRGKRWGTENQAINTPIQGSAGGLIKWVMAELHELWARTTAPARFVAQVHDELVVETVPLWADRVDRDMEVTMARAGEVFGLLVPITSSGGMAATWAEAKG